MSLHLRGGLGGGEAPPEPAVYGPSVGSQYVRDHAAPLAVSDPGTGYTFATMSELQTKINANAANSIFVATASSYTLSGAFGWTTGKHPRIYVPGAPGSKVFNGASGDNYINCPTDGLEWRGGTFRNVGNASSAVWMAAIISRGNTVIEDVEFDTCYKGVGYDGSTAVGTLIYRRLYAHDCLFQGLQMTGSGTTPLDSPLVEHCRVRNCNTGRFSLDDTASGMKNLHVTNGIWRYNWFDANIGFQLWWDACEAPITAYDNVIENGVRAGLFYEISSGGTRLHNNLLLGNGYGDALDAATDWNNWQILVSCSDGTLGAGTGIEIDHNIVDGTGRLIGLLNHDVHPFDTKMVDVNANQIWARGSSAKLGGSDQQVTKTLWTTGSNHFDAHEYHQTDLANSNWQWSDATGGATAKTFAQWQAYGFDATATRTVI